MHTLLMEPFQVYDLVTLSLTFMMNIAILDLITAGCINLVLQTHILFNIIYQYSLNIKRGTLILNFLSGFVKYLLNYNS